MKRYGFYLLIAAFLFSCHKEDKPDNNFLSIDKTDIRLDTAAGTTELITINSSVAWKAEIASGAAGWLQLDKVSGEPGKTMVKVSSIHGNPSPAVGAVTFRPVDRGFPRPVVLNVTQKAYSFRFGFNKLYGGSGDESARWSKTMDGGFIVAVTTNSVDGDVRGNHGGASDAWIVRLNPSGDTLWTKALGGAGDDNATAIKENMDGSFVMTGYTNSEDGTITDKRPGYGVDLWIVKMDANGRVLWSKTFGGTNEDGGEAIASAPDGGCVIAGLTTSNDGDVSGSHGSSDVWMIKVDAGGRLQWAKAYGGSDWEEPRAIVATTDGYVVSGLTFSGDGDVRGFHPPDYIGADFLVLKIGADGSKLWARAYGGSDDEVSTCITTVGDDYVVAGYASSKNGDVAGLHGPTTLLDDMWVLRLNKDGQIIWARTFGGTSLDAAVAITATPDGGVVLGGATFSTNGDVSGLHAGGDADAWIVKLDGAGNKQWTKTLGGSGDEQADGIFVSGDGFAILGITTSMDGDVSGRNHGSYDLWVTRLIVQ